MIFSRSHLWSGFLYPESERKVNNMPRGQPKRFTNGRQLIELWTEFNDDIKRNGFILVPTQSNFCRWLSMKYDTCDRKTVYNALNKYFPTVKKAFEQIQSDTIAEGAMLGHYQSAMSIFALKNWCSWTDRQEISSTVTASVNPFSELTTEELKKLAEE